mmetsp:Transcript_15566/g.25927  ORF Transcript_15566/g.25927 Transcript_15566/m.25927 type:complete len:80 (+) Transcript_15566:85-324(+)
MTSTALPLLRSLLREARHINDYNFRSYAVRRVKAGFDKNRNLTGEEAAVAMRDGEEQLQVLKRQVVLGQLYPSSRSVME